MEDLEFIKDVALRKTIEDSIEYTYALFEEAKKNDKSELYQQETNRVMILYTVSVIEAVLLYLYKLRGESMTFIDYKFVQHLPESYRHINSGDSSVIVAVQKINTKAEHQIGLSELINFLKEKKLITEATATELRTTNDLRNTFHLNKPREKVSCDIAQVERALKLLVYVIQRAPKSLSKSS